VARPKGSGQTPASRRVRVRSRPLEQIDEAKLAVALAIMARRLLEQQRQDEDRPDDGADVQEAV
jgi:hypothetical protein